MFSNDCEKRRRFRGELMSGLDPPYIRPDIERLSAKASALNIQRNIKIILIMGKDIEQGIKFYYLA